MNQIGGRTAKMTARWADVHLDKIVQIFKFWTDKNGGFGKFFGKTFMGSRERREGPKPG